MLVRWNRLGGELAADPIRLLGKHDPPAKTQRRQGTSHTPQSPTDDQNVRFGLQRRLTLYASVPIGQGPGYHL
jgi:hypothetical protein